MMSGTSVDAAGPTIAADMAAAAADLGPAVARFENAQADAKAFMAEHGAAVNDGHAAVGWRPPDAPIGA